ncbi:hypothetical protein URS_1185 [Acinetobacter ursingii]|nr:hypothetical protein URS_1185 [Acinetobacter ursingii]
MRSQKAYNPFLLKAQSDLGCAFLFSIKDFMTAKTSSSI